MKSFCNSGNLLPPRLPHPRSCPSTDLPLLQDLAPRPHAGGRLPSRSVLPSPLDARDREGAKTEGQGTCGGRRLASTPVRWGGGAGSPSSLGLGACGGGRWLDAAPGRLLLELDACAGLWALKSQGPRYYFVFSPNLKVATWPTSSSAPTMTLVRGRDECHCTASLDT
jgi:hypothetical protein